MLGTSRGLASPGHGREASSMRFRYACGQCEWRSKQVRTEYSLGKEPRCPEHPESAPAFRRDEEAT